MLAGPGATTGARGADTRYSARPQALAAPIDWMSLYDAFWRGRFDCLEALLNRIMLMAPASGRRRH
jgi:hypothetical protein